jgi:hypothetical protein
MAQGTTTFPTTLDSERSNPSNMDTSEAALLAMQAMLGVTDSAVATSHEYLIKHKPIALFTGADAGTLALTKTTGVKVLTKGSAGAYTLAAPSAAEAGSIIQVVAGTAYAHTITATGLIDDGVTGGSKTTVTFGAYVGSSITLLAYNLKWVVLAINVAPVS